MRALSRERREAQPILASRVALQRSGGQLSTRRQQRSSGDPLHWATRVSIAHGHGYRCLTNCYFAGAKVQCARWRLWTLRTFAWGTGPGLEGGSMLGHFVFLLLQQVLRVQGFGFETLQSSVFRCQVRLLTLVASCRLQRRLSEAKRAKSYKQ